MLMMRYCGTFLCRQSLYWIWRLTGSQYRLLQHQCYTVKRSQASNKSSGSVVKSWEHKCGDQPWCNSATVSWVIAVPSTLIRLVTNQPVATEYSCQRQKWTEHLYFGMSKRNGIQPLENGSKLQSLSFCSLSLTWSASGRAGQRNTETWLLQRDHKVLYVSWNLVNGCTNA